MVANPRPLMWAKDTRAGAHHDERRAPTELEKQLEDAWVDDFSR
jgi:hypothetical protein